jgi:hypothetical protein
MHIAAVLLTALAAAAPVNAADLAIWPVDALTKVFPQDAPGTSRANQDTWLVARNGHASVQFAVRSATRIKALNVRTTVDGGLQLKIRHVGYVPVSSSPPDTPEDELLRPAPAFFPDPLLESFPYELPANRTDAVWLTVYAPASTKPGVYRGEAVFETENGRAVTQPYRIRVVEAIVPATQTLRVTNWFSTSPEHLARYYEVSNNEDAFWQVLANIGSVMADHKQNVILTPVRSLATPRIDGDRITYDFARFDRWVETFDKAGIRIIEGGHLLGRESGYHTALRVPASVIEDGKIVERKLEPDDTRAEAFLASFTSQLYTHLQERGWTSRYIQHIHDEPHDEERPYYNRFAKVIRKNLPGIPTLDAVSLDQDLDFFADVADIWVPVLGSFDKEMGKIREHVAGGGQAWFYTCIFPQERHLNRFIDLPLIKTRLLHWFNFRHDFSGFLHWGGNYWSAEPFANVQPIINDGRTLLPAGDNAIVYPWPEKNSVLSSIRLEAMREGIEDYELLVALAKTDPDKARALAKEAVPEFTDYIRDVPAFRRLQARLLGQ